MPEKGLCATTEDHTAMKERATMSGNVSAITQEKRELVSEQHAYLDRGLDEIPEVNGVNRNLFNFTEASETGAIFLDRHLRIKRFTPPVEVLFDIGRTDVGRPLASIPHRLSTDVLPVDAARVLREHVLVERELQHTTSRKRFLTHLLPYYTLDDAVAGVVITFVEITDRKQTDERLAVLIAKLEEQVNTRAAQIKQLTSELILSEQTERQRIAQILHDELQQLLYAFKVKVDLQKKDLSRKQAARLSQATTLIDHALKIMRTLTVDLSPLGLNGEDVKLTLERLASRMEDMHDLKVEIESPDPILLKDDLRILVYQLVRELLFNVVKHAGIDRARVKITSKNDHLVVLVEDQGAGFDLQTEQISQTKTKGGFGLRKAQQRLEILGGTLEYDTSPGKGTRITFVVPIEHEHSDTGSTLGQVHEIL